MTRAKEIDKKIAELWPDTCPECGLPAWFGAVNITCVSKTCKNGSGRERDKYAKLLGEKIEWLVNQELEPSVDEDADTEPRGKSLGLFDYWDNIDNKVD